MKWIVQLWDTDTESWEDCDGIYPCHTKYEAEQEAKDYVRNMAYHVKWRVVTF